MKVLFLGDCPYSRTSNPRIPCPTIRMFLSSSLILQSLCCCRFSLECSDQEVESLDISVSVGLLESGKEGGGGQNVNSGGRTGLGHSNMSFGGGLVTPAGGGGLFGGGGLQLGQQGSGGLVLNQPDPGAATRQQRLKGELKLEEFDKAQLK